LSVSCTCPSSCTGKVAESIYKNRTVCLSDRLCVGMSNGRNANHSHCQLMLSRKHCGHMLPFSFVGIAPGRRLGRARPHARMFTQMCKIRRRRGRGRLQRATIEGDVIWLIYAKGERERKKKGGEEGEGKAIWRCVPHS